MSSLVEYAALCGGVPNKKTILEDTRILMHAEANARKLNAPRR